MAQVEPFSDHQDPDHPVEYQPADNGPVRWVTEAEAIRRLTGYGHDPDHAATMLALGRTIRTPFAFYRLPALAGPPETSL